MPGPIDTVINSQMMSLGVRIAGGMPRMPWREKFKPASFRAAKFYTDIDGYTGGRRIALHEYPKKNGDAAWYSEDMGQRARRHQIVGYVIANQMNGFNYIPDRDRLIEALNKEGAGQLIHPFLGNFQAICHNFGVQEFRERGGVAVFEMQFFGVGEAGDAVVAINTPQQVAAASTKAETEAVNGFVGRSQTTKSNVTGRTLGVGPIGTWGGIG